MHCSYDILNALGTDLATFFSANKERQDGPVYLREHMRAISDSDRTYAIFFGRQPGVGMKMFDETIRPSKRWPPWRR